MRLSFIVLIAVCLGLAACSEAGDVAKPDLRVERVGWDSLVVTVRFVEDGLLGQEAMQPDTIRVAVLGVDSDSLATAVPLSHDSTAVLRMNRAARIEQRFGVTVRDARMGSRERYVIEACGQFGRRAVCEQHALEASPKRVVSETSITFPEDERFSSGTYAIPVRVERHVAAVYLADSTGMASDSVSESAAPAEATWERIGIGQPRRTLTAHVVQEPSARVAVPLAGRAGRFRLEDDSDGFSDFYFAVRSRLRSTDSVLVRFETTLRLGRDAVGGPVYLPIGGVTVAVSQKGDDDRETEADFYARTAAQQLIRRMNSKAGRSGDWYEVRRWEYDRVSRRYRIEIDFAWADPAFPDDRQRVAGTLEVGEGGERGLFRLRDGNRRAFRRWRVHFGEDRVELEPLPRWRRGL